MSVPSDIRKLLGNREPKAHATLSCSLQGPIGETHFVVADGQLFVFERESLIGDFRPVALDPAHPPKLEKGTFNDTLYLPLADGSANELNVSSFERDGIIQVLEQAAAPAAPAPEPPREHAPVPPPEPPRQEAADSPLPGFSHPEAKAASGDADVIIPADADEGDALEDDQQGKDVAIYYGSDPGWAGCLAQLLVFSAGVAGLWYLHTQAMLNVGVVEPEDEYADSLTFVLTKIVAVIAGVYLGGKLASMLGKLMRGANMTGRVVFVKGRVLIMGPRTKWQVTLDQSRPINLHGGAHSIVEESKDSQGKPNKRSFNIFLRIEQDGNEAMLKTMHHFAGAPGRYAGVELAHPAEAWTHPRTLTVDEKTFRKIAKRLRAPQN